MRILNLIILAFSCFLEIFSITLPLLKYFNITIMKKQYLNFVLSALLAGGLVSQSFAQGTYKCGTTKATQKMYNAHPELIQDEQAYNTMITDQVNAKKQMGATRAVEQVYIIPVVFHIIHTYGSENISDAQVIDQVNILNRDYRLLNTDISNAAQNTPFDTLAADTKIEFRLAQLDPDGNCTNGIDRIYSHKTNSADDGSKLNQWPRQKYLNVWVVKSIGDVGVAGYAYHPATVNGALYPFDGILILHNYIGSTGTGSTFNSRALTHEVGHWLNLQHPWGNNNDPEVACGDDLVSDTPETMGHTSCDLYTPICDVAAIANLFTFSNVTTTSGTTDPTIVPADSGTQYNSFTANGVSSNPDVAGQFSYFDWDTGGAAANNDTTYALLTGSINTGKYYEITISPKYGKSMTITGINFTFQRSATGPRTYAVRSSVNSFASNLTPSIAPANPALKVRNNAFYSLYDTTASMTGSRVTLAAGYVNKFAPITFRIYAWNAEDTTGSFSIDNFTFSGSAGTIENTQNYMDYSYCSIMFTKGQKDRMRVALESPISGRSNLWSAENLAATGTDGTGVPCKPRPDFYANRYFICPGATVTFSKNIMNTIGTAPTVQWFFEGGSPATSTAASPTVTYSTAGDYNVKLVATNSAGTDSIIKTDVISVSSGPFYYGPATENFEVVNNYFFQYKVNNYDAGSNTWGLSSSAGSSGNHSVLMTAYNNYSSDVDDLITPGFNMYSMSGVTMTFKCAAATRATSTVDMTEELKVYSSSDCGATWAVRKSFTAFGTNAFVNNGFHPEYYIPSSPSEWTTHTVTIPGSLVGSNVRFKFEYTSGPLGNNVYIDDININGVVGIDENILSEGSVSIYPNPSNSSSTVTYHLNKKANVNIQLVDMLGKKVMEQSISSQPEGDYSIQISKDQLKLQNGIYFVRFTVDNNSVTKKLVITE
jgi:PKD repeat protein